MSSVTRLCQVYQAYVLNIHLYWAYAYVYALRFHEQLLTALKQFGLSV